MKYEPARPSTSLAIAAALLLAACGGEEPSTGTAGAALISDQLHNGGTPGFYFLPPTVPGPTPRPADVFEPRLLPVVRIDRIDPVTGATLQQIVTFDSVHRVHGTQVRRNARRGYYIVRWRTDDYDLSAAATYRIRVLVDGHQLGFADVDVVRTRNQMRNVDTDEYVALKLNTTLPIEFRIERRAVDRDGDGVFDWRDNCPSTPNGPGAPAWPGGWHDTPGCDREADECDPEEDDCHGGDYVQLDTDHDGIGDACECDAVVCAPADACHGAGTCQSTTGTCAYPTLPDDDGDGACNAIDECPADPAKTAAGACGCGVADTDTDGDGTADCTDLCPLDPTRTEPGACGCSGGGGGGGDTDGDGTPDCTDACPLDAHKTEPGVCGCGVLDTDSDGDGTPNCLDACLLDSHKTEPGVCGCGVSDADLDGDGLPSCQDGCSLDPDKIAPGVCGCGVPDTDTDGDGAADCHDACRLDPGKRAPGVCGCGVPDTDGDGDGTPDCHDACALDPGKTAPGTCGCGVADTDGDGDGTADCVDGCVADPAKVDPGTCGCGAAEDPTDTDTDGTWDCADACRFDPFKTAAGACGCGLEDIDGDVDGLIDCVDPCPGDHDNTCPVACVSDHLADQTVQVGVTTSITIDLLDTEVVSVDDDGNLMVIPPGGGDAVANKLDAFFQAPPGSPQPAHRFAADPGNPHAVELEVVPFREGGHLATVELTGEVFTTGCVSSPVPFDAVCEGTTDFDLDGTGDCTDGCPIDPDKTAPGDCGCGLPDLDADGNGVSDCLEW